VSAVEWVDPATLRANAWNPNKQAPPESRLLKLSLMEDGWTAPIVVGTDDEIIDGFYRWTLGLRDQDVRSLTGGLVPIVRVGITPEHRRLSTVRHNRARGTHHDLGMADIVAELLAMGLNADEIGRRLQMDHEEVDRLADSSQMTKRGSAAAFGNRIDELADVANVAAFLGLKGPDSVKRNRHRTRADGTPCHAGARRGFREGASVDVPVDSHQPGGRTRRTVALRDAPAAPNSAATPPPCSS
jgi:hypothetical protein